MTTRHENDRIREQLYALETLQVTFCWINASVKLLEEIANWLLLKLSYLNLLFDSINTTKFFINKINLSLVKFHWLFSFMHLAMGSSDNFHLLIYCGFELFYLC